MLAVSDLPAPLVPADCDLRGYDFMPLFGHRLFSSEFYARATDAEFRAAMRLWWSAWQQCPAGSLPADDAALALLADYGRDSRGFAKVRNVALHGFVLCADGRLYHPVLCAEATRAYERRAKERERKATLRARKNDAQPVEIKDAAPPMSRGTDAGRDAERAGREQDRTVQDKEETSYRKSLARTARGARLAPDWRPSDADAGFAASLGLDPDRVAASFRDYWTAATGRTATKADWSATWRNWCRREQERPSRPSPQRESKMAWLIRDLGGNPE